MYFLVFTGRKWENVMGKQGITWEIAGVFDAPDRETACLVAAQETGAGTCFAIEGFAWGVDTVEAKNVRKLGVASSPLDRLERMGDSIAASFAALAESTQRHLPAADGEASDDE